MAIGKSFVGSGFKGICQYTIQKKEAELLYMRGLVTTKPTLIAKQMRAVADTHNIKKPVFHASISLKIGETLTKESAQLAADEYLTKMGFDVEQTQYFVVRHNDTKHPHIHIVANRIQLNNKVVSDFQHKSRTFEATRAAELAACFVPFESKKDRQIRIQETRDKIDTAFNNSKGILGGFGLEKFKIELAKAGIEMVENRSKTTNKLFGISFKTADHHYKGSSLGKDYSLNGLQNRGLQIEHGKAHTHSKTRLAGHDSARATQARVDSEKAKLHGHTNQAKSSAQADENKRLKVLEHHKKLEQEEEYE